MQNTIEQARALKHQAEACYLTIANHQRVHAYQTIGSLAQMETRMLGQNKTEKAGELEKMIQNCLTCIKTTAATGKCYHCTKDDLKKFVDKHAESSKQASKWHKLEVPK